MACGISCEPAWRLSLGSLHSSYIAAGSIEQEELIYPLEIEPPLPVRCRLIRGKLAGEKGDVLLGQLFSRSIVFHQIVKKGMR